MLQQKTSTQLHPNLSHKKPILTRYLSLVTVVLVSLVIVGILLTIIRTQKSSPKQAESSVLSPTGIYMLSQKDWSTDYISRLDPITKEQQWKRELKAVDGPLVVKGNTIYTTALEVDAAGKEHDYIYALSTNTGATRWRVELRSIISSSPNQFSFPGALSTPTEENGIVYISARDGKLYALLAATGKQLWSYDSNTTAFINGTTYGASSPLVKDGVVYETIHNILYALNAQTGERLWLRKVDPSQVFNDPIVTNGVLYTSAFQNSHSGSSSPQGHVYAFNIQDGTQRWRYDIKREIVSSPTIARGVVYFGSLDQHMYALNANNGSVLWNQKVGGQVYFTPIIANDVIYSSVSGNANEKGDTTSTTAPALLALDARSGKMLWQTQTKGFIQAIYHDIIYIGIQPGTLATFTSKGGKLIWSQKYGEQLIDKTGQESQAAPLITIVE